MTPKELKIMALDGCIKLCEIGMKLPIFNFHFIINAPNDEIERFIRDSFVYQGDENNPGAEEDRESELLKCLDNFRHSDDYNIEDGRSQITLSVRWTFDNISYTNIRSIVDCKGFKDARFVKFIFPNVDDIE